MNGRRSPDLIRQERASLDASIAAETAFNYLGVFLDDIGRVLPIALGQDASEYSKRDSLSRVKKLLLTQLDPLMAELDTPDSWWQLGFVRAAGARQRFVHYPDHLSVQGEKGPGDRRVKVKLNLMDASSGNLSIEVVSRMQHVLEGMCGWLDGLEAKTITLVRQNLPDWSLPKACPSLFVPVGYPKVRRLPVHFLYLPVCKGSAPLTQSVRYRGT